MTGWNRDDEDCRNMKSWRHLVARLGNLDSEVLWPSDSMRS
jgi:hypothetical protein